MNFPMEKSAIECEGTTIVVGIKVDEESKELLTWALLNVAQANDHIIAVHVLPAVLPDFDGKLSTLNSIVNALNSMIDAYGVHCNLKQIDLKVKISRGSSIRRVLVQEASLASASKLIVGVSQCDNEGFSYFSISVAKYCANKLSGGCLVLAVNNGSVIFHGEMAGDRNLDDCEINKQTRNDVDLARSSLYCLRPRLSCDTISSYASKFSLRFNSLKNENCAANDSPSEPLCTPSPGESAQRRHGWSVFRRSFWSHKKNSLLVMHNDSSVQSAKQIPRWYSFSSVVHPDHKRTKSADIDRSGCDGVKPMIPSFDVDDETKNLSKELMSLQEKYSSGCRIFSCKELEQATSNFSPENIIGKGGNSRVYKGQLFDNKELALKVLEPSDDVLKNFISEIEIMSNLHHKNIIYLTGFCFENKCLVLVYDFLSRGSLEDNLHGNNEGRNSPGWTERYKIAVGVAEALEYLHESSSTQTVIHRDVKSSNILLSDDFEPQLSDFGLARLASTCTKNTTSSDLEGTFGYLAPECFAYGEVNEKVDVYAFGVVLLELLSGRKPVCIDGPKGQESLVLWAKPILRAWKLEQVLDPCLSENYNKDEMERMCLAASLCIREAPGYRPSIALVLKLIKGDDEAIKWAKSELGSSMLFHSMDEATIDNLNIQSHISLALLDVDDDVTLSVSSRAHSFDFTTSSISLEKYLKER